MLNFFYLLDTAFNMWLHFTLEYHPEDDGQTECMNQTLCHILSLLVHKPILYSSNNLFKL